MAPPLFVLSTCGSDSSASVRGAKAGELELGLSSRREFISQLASLPVVPS